VADVKEIEAAVGERDRPPLGAFARDGFRELLPRNDTAGPVGVQELRLP